MSFRYDDWFPAIPSVGYKTLNSDVMAGDPTLGTPQVNLFYEASH